MGTKTTWKVWLAAGAIAVAISLAAPVPARANSLLGDTFSITLACYGNPLCASATAGNPYTATLVSPYIVPNNQAGFSFYDPTLSVAGNFNNNPSQVGIEFTGLDSNFNQLNLPSGGFLGVYMTALSPQSDPLKIIFANTGGTTDGFSISTDVSYASDLTAQLNFAGLTGGVGQDKAVLNIVDVQGSAAVPEPSTWTLLGAGLLLASMAWGWRRRLAGTRA